MPRKTRPRKIVKPPGFRFYKPDGCVDLNQSDVELLYEEYEALKLADYDGMHHQQAAELMDVSRATFARIYESARRKIAKALVEVRQIKTVFGNADIDNKWFKCSDCNTKFNIPKNFTENICPFCGSFKIFGAN
jgi:predicted DNA-binding protein (UPF0251 family)